MCAQACRWHGTGLREGVMKATIYFIAELDDGEPNILKDGPFIDFARAAAAVDLQDDPAHCVIVSTTLHMEPE